MTQTQDPKPQTTTAPAPLPPLPRFTLPDIRARQNLGAAALAGFAVAIAGALLWALATLLSESEWGLMAIAVGYLVGKTIARVGRGVDKKFGILGATLAGVGVLAGNFLCVLILFARQSDIALSHLPHMMSAHMLAVLLPSMFRPMDFVFYAIAIYEGYRLSFKYKIRKQAAPLPNKTS